MVDAILISLAGDVATLQKVENGETLEVPMEKLSNADRIWIRRINSDDKKKAALAGTTATSEKANKELTAAANKRATPEEPKDEESVQLDSPKRRPARRLFESAAFAFFARKGRGIKRLWFLFLKEPPARR